MKNYLINHAKCNKVSFHMPGHKGANIYRENGYEDFLKNIVDCDITEIPGADNLFQPEGIIREAEKLYEDLYNVKKSFLLINGTTAGILASVLSSVAPGKKLLMSRGCHKSVYNSLTLGNIKPVYIQPETYEEMGIMGEISPASVKAAIVKDKDIEAVILPSPNYYGVCSDVKAIADVVHEAGKILIVDQAHGAHLKFFHKFKAAEDMPQAAEDCGADIVINSIHKTLASFTQSAILNVTSDRVDVLELAEKLQLVQSTSPSYILMCSLVINGEMIMRQGKQLFERWIENLDWFYKNAKEIEGLSFTKGENFDRTKININLGEMGISGNDLNDYLQEKGIITELVTGDIVMAMTGIGNIKSDFEKLLGAIKDKIEMNGTLIADKRLDTEIRGYDIPKPGRIRAHGNEKVEMSLADSIGEISSANIIPYPPGIPFICRGEEITEEAVIKLERLRKENKLIYGISNKGLIHVYKSE